MSSNLTELEALEMRPDDRRQSYVQKWSRVIVLFSPFIIKSLIPIFSREKAVSEHFMYTSCQHRNCRRHMQMHMDTTP